LVFAGLPKVSVGDAVKVGRLSILPTPFLDLRRTLSVVLHRQRYRGAVLEAFLASLRGLRAP